MMRVAIDTNGLYTTQAGVARYIRGLLRGHRENSDQELVTHEFAWPVVNFAYRQPARMLKTFYRDFVWKSIIGPVRLRRLAPGVLHSTVGAYVSPPAHIAHVVTVHDMAVFRYPERFRRWQGRSGRAYMLRAGNADEVICISQFTADELMSLTGIPAQKIHVIYNGCDFQGNEPVVESIPDFPLPAEFFLFVGSLEPGKNLKLLRAVYELAADRGVKLPDLLIVGARWQGVATEGRPPSNWRYLGRQPDDILVHLYRRALALAFPSKYEGFGLPVAEAMALGCPVVCAPVASLPEVGGTAACFAPLDPEAWLSVMADIATNGARRREAVAAGYEQARKFSWARCASETASVYRRCNGRF